MSLANLFNIPAAEQDLLVWSFHNQAEHALAVSALGQQGKGNIPLYLLDPIPLGEQASVWARVHQEAHNSINAILGVNGADFTDFSMEDKGELSSWIQLHANEHLQWADKLGIG